MLHTPKGNTPDKSGRTVHQDVVTVKFKDGINLSLIHI